MVRVVKPDDVGISVSYPLPNTRLFEMVRADRAPAKTNWQDSGDLDLMFRGTYTSQFYRALADALHAEVRNGPTTALSLWKVVRELEPVSRTEAPAEASPLKILDSHAVMRR